MNAWLRNHFQSDELPPADILTSAYLAAVRVVADAGRFPNADRATLSRLIEEMEADAEICNILAEQGI